MTFGQRPPLHVVQIGFFNDPRRRAPRELLQSWTTLSDVAQAARRGGDASALAAALQKVAARRGAATRAAVRGHFERELSSAALGTEPAAMYADVTGCGRSTPKAECALHQSA